MIRLLPLLLAGALTSPAAAQHAGHSMPGMTMPKAKAKAPAPKRKAAPPAKKKATAPVRKKASAPARKKAATPAKQPRVGQQPKPEGPVDPHAGHDMGSMPDMPPTDPHAGHAMPAQTVDPHAGHGSTSPAPPVLTPPPQALGGPDHAADAVFGTAAMAQSREMLREEHGGMSASKLLVDRLEAGIRDGRDGWTLDAQGWTGGDIDKLWVKAELEGELGGKLDGAEVQALWSHAVDPWFDVQTGVRFDPQRGPNRTHLVLGVQGLAPYWWELDGTLFLSTKGELTARAEAEYDLRITQKLVLQPRIEADLSAQRIAELRLGSGLTSAEVGARLRYQVTATAAPYVGLAYQRAFGGTRRFRLDKGEQASGWSILTGLRFWF
jgi:copper resistance protein B